MMMMFAENTEGVDCAISRDVTYSRVLPVLNDIGGAPLLFVR